MALQLSAQSFNSPQFSAQTPTSECAGQVESIIVGRINKEKFHHISVYMFLFKVLLGINFKCTFYSLRELI